MTTPVNFSTAKLLKEKGFDNLCKHLWHYNGIDRISMPNKNSENFGFSAPIIAEVVMWLYEKHGIWVGVKPSCDGTEWYSEMFTANEQVWNDLDKRYQINTAFRNYKSIHSTPTEAYEATIEYSLKNLII